MVETSWQKVVSDLQQLCAEPTEAQRAAAAALGLPLTEATPAPVAAALLRARLGTELELRKPAAFGDTEYEYLERLAAETHLDIPSSTEIGSRELLDAWIKVALAQRSVVHLERLNPEAGDVVVIAAERGTSEDRNGLIASISSNGRLNFRGGRGGGGWPHLVKRIVKAGGSEYIELCRKAREEAEARNSSPELVSAADRARLDRWKTDRHPTLAAREALKDALADATEERPMQVVLQNHPSLLAHMITGNHGTWVRPQVQFGNHYMADFLIAGRTSVGLRWILVELESPTHRLTNPGNHRASPTLRHAVDQIEDWRQWLTSNLAYARAPRDSDGLGLPGITADARGLIIMGREDSADSASEIRDTQFRNSRIEVRTYDWLLRAAEDMHSLGWGLFDIEIGVDEDDW